MTLDFAANRAKDLYYQDYEPDEAFFDVDDFKFHFASIYNTKFDALFQLMRKGGKSEDGFSNVEISAAWLVKEQLKTVEDKVTGTWYVTPSSGIFPFGFDEFSYALDPIKIVGDKKCKLQKLSRMEAQYMDLAPTTSLCYYWLDAENRITFTGDVGDVLVPYIPRVDSKKDNCVLSDFIVSDVIKDTLTLMFGAKNGNIIDESNDSNKNSTPVNQTNPQLEKIRQ